MKSTFPKTSESHSHENAQNYKFQNYDEKKMNYTAKPAKNLPSQTCDAKTMNYTKN